MRVKHSDFRLVILAVWLVFALSGCIIASGIDSYKKLGISSGDRVTLLGDEMKLFHDAIMWGKMDEALFYAQKESRPSILAELRKNGSDERIVETKVEHVEFSPDSYEAEVDTVVKYYEIPLYVVKERREMEKWKFELGDGWQILSKTRAG